MILFSKILPALGIGGALVDTQPQVTEIEAGDTLCGEIHIYGGKVAQEIKSVTLTLKAELAHTREGLTMRDIVDLSRTKLDGNWTIEAGQEVVRSFSLLIPSNTPVSLFGQNVWVHTDLSLANAVAGEDRDYLYIKPHRQMQQLLDALEAAGFVLENIVTERFQYVEHSADLGQIYIFRPKTYRDDGCDELRARFELQEKGIAMTWQMYRGEQVVFVERHFFAESELQTHLEERVKIMLAQTKKQSRR